MCTGTNFGSSLFFCDGVFSVVKLQTCRPYYRHANIVQVIIGRTYISDLLNSASGKFGNLPENAFESTTTAKNVS